MKVYGPYTRKDGRKHCIIVTPTYRRTISYSKLLLENKLGRTLIGNETTDHIDKDFTNDSLTNLRVLSRAENSKNCAGRRVFTFSCPMCRLICEKDFNNILGNWKKGYSGPFCGKRCARKFQLAPLSQSAEERVLNTRQCRFESDAEHQFITAGKITRAYTN